MAKYEWFCMGIFIFILILNMCSTKQQRRLCHDGLITPGYTDPHGDILIEDGTPLDITCTLNDDYVARHGPNSSSSLYFMQGDTIISEEYVQILNSSSIRLHIAKATKSSSMYTCKLRDDNNAVCLNNVVVGTKPLPVTDFECIGYNYENLTCTWTAPENYAKTEYNLTYFFPGRAARYLRNNCSSLSIIENKMTNEKKMSCLWTVTSRPQYRQAQRTYYFELNIKNKFGALMINKTFSHFQHVLSGPPENLTCVNKTSESLLLRWSVPFAMQAFPPGLQHRIVYMTKYDNKTWQFGGLIQTTTSEEMKHVYFNLTNLKYAHVVYDIRVSMRSCAAAPDDESMWSKNASITVPTESKIPDAPPKTNIGSFEVITSGKSLSYREVYIYWQRLPEVLRNGDNFSYEVVIDGSASMIKPVESTRTYAKFTNLKVSENYTFHIWARNSVGRSKHKTTVFVPKESQRLGEPTEFTKIAYNNGPFELSWEPPKSRSFYNSEVQNYTIFWCEDQKDRPYQCVGYLDWMVVPSDNRTLNITVPNSTLNYQFAISANTDESSSGMMWATCTVIYDRAITKLNSVRISRVGSDYIELNWKLDCADRIGSIEGFVIYYCSIVSPSDTSCKEKEQNKTVVGTHGSSSVEVANITGLKPYETYMLAVAVLTQKGLSRKSDYLYQTTLESAPSPPLNIEIFNLTNSTISLSWQKPSNTNGKLKYYKIEVSKNSTKTTIEVDSEKEEYVIDGLMSYEIYNISIIACTVACSDLSPAVIVRTKEGYPNQIKKPTISSKNGTMIVVDWNPPIPARGKLDYYEVSFKEKLENENKTNAIVNVTGTSYLVNCGPDAQYNDFYLSVRAVNIFDDVSHEGPWSDELHWNCRSFYNWWIWILVPIGVVLVAALFYMAKRMYLHWQKMRDVEVKLPPGLAPVVTTEIGLSHWGPKIQEEQSRHLSADEELLLVKMSHSGDSSGCSSGHESVTSSLESGTHLSTTTSDSGTEQPHFKNISSPDLMRQSSIQSTDVEDKPLYVQVSDTPNTVIKPLPDSYTWHQPSIDVLPAKTGYVSIGDAPGTWHQPTVDILPAKTGYVSIGDAPGPRTICVDTTKGYIPHRHFDAKIKED